MDTFLCILVQKKKKKRRLTNRIFLQRQKTLYTNEKLQAKIEQNRTEKKDTFRAKMAKRIEGFLFFSFEKMKMEKN